MLAAGINPLIHYLKFGRAEGRMPVRRDYAAWIEQYDRLSDDDRLVFRRASERLSRKPLISVLLPVYNTNPAYLERAIPSVTGQLYPHWELCISDDASTDPVILQPAAKENRWRA